MTELTDSSNGDKQVLIQCQLDAVRLLTGDHVQERHIIKGGCMYLYSVFVPYKASISRLPTA